METAGEKTREFSKLFDLKVLCVCECVCVCVCICMQWCMCVHVQMHSYVCVCACSECLAMCMCLCACVCVNVSDSISFQKQVVSVCHNPLINMFFFNFFYNALSSKIAGKKTQVYSLHWFCMVRCKSQLTDGQCPCKMLTTHQSQEPKQGGKYTETHACAWQSRIRKINLPDRQCPGIMPSSLESQEQKQGKSKSRKKNNKQEKPKQENTHTHTHTCACVTIKENWPGKRWQSSSRVFIFCSLYKKANTWHRYVC